LMKNLWDAVPTAKQGAYAATSAELKEHLLPRLRAGDAVMIKGSLGSKMGLVVDGLRKQFPAVKKDI
jgi:UDP-N-acetylmuramoyl-tripeptide--D-alanyl-D-alanine ligase